MKVLASAFRCAQHGRSESFVGYNWVRQISKFAETTLITTDDRAKQLDGIRVIHIENSIPYLRSIIGGMYGTIKPHYFVFDIRSRRRYRSELGDHDIYHHVVPQGPRYPSALGRVAKRFVLGPVGGGLRVPKALRDQVETDEAWYLRLRKLDRLRFNLDPTLHRTYDRADVLLLTADYMRDIVPDRYQRNVEIIVETGINPEDYAECSADRSPADVVRLLYVGRITPYKGLKFLLRAVAALPSDLKQNVRLMVVGDDSTSYAAYCKELTQKLKLESVVEFAGRMPKAVVQAYYSQADLFCFPTLAETTGNVILEAMASGLPIVSVRHGGPSEVIDESCGFLCEADSESTLVESLADSLGRLAEDPELRISLGKGAQRRVFEKFTWDQKGKRLRDIYASIL